MSSSVPPLLSSLAIHAPVATSHPISLLQAIVLGLLQGVSELFPVSSLGHTVLFPTLFGWHSVVQMQSKPESPWLAFVVMLHVGSALGLLAYFWRDWVEIIGAFFRSLARRRIETPAERLAWLIVVASIPAGVLGVALEHPLRVALAKPAAASYFLIANGLILLSAEALRRRAAVRAVVAAHAAVPGSVKDGGEAEDGRPTRRLDTLEFKEAGIIGVAQSSALIAGISRDGVCMTAGLGRGLDHEDSARFAFLLATPIILAAGLYKIPDLTGSSGQGVRGVAVVACLCAAAAAVFSVAFLMRWFKTRTLRPFGVYCLLFGVAMACYTAVH